MMKYMDKSIEELHDLLVKGEVTSDELVKESLELSHEVQDKCNAFVTILDDAKGGEVTDNLLSGIPYGVKDNYSTKGILTTGSSNTLKDYVPFFDATAYAKLKEAGAIMVNKTVLDEFEAIDENIDLINKIEGISEDIPEESYDIDTLLANCDEHEDGEVIVPKVVG